MLKIKEAKEEIVFFVNENGFAESTNFYDFVMRFEDENKFRVEYIEDIEIEEETGKCFDNGKYRVRFCKVNRPSVLLDEDFENEDEAEDFCFDRVFNYDFQKSCENTFYYGSEEEAEADIIQMISDNEYIDKEVAASIFRKSKIVFEKRAELAKIHRAKIDKEYAARKAYLSTAVPAEAESLVIDEKFKEDVKAAGQFSGNEKSNKCASALKGLIQRSGKEKIESDFWQVFRVLKAKIKTS